jgi:hypothetical protein
VKGNGQKFEVLITEDFEGSSFEANQQHQDWAHKSRNKNVTESGLKVNSNY